MDWQAHAIRGLRRLTGRFDGRGRGNVLAQGGKVIGVGNPRRFLSEQELQLDGLTS